MREDSQEVFATSVGCIDGRAVRALDQYAKEEYGAYVDTISKAGMDKYFNDPEHEMWEGIKEDVQISVSAHNSTVVFVHGHDECAGNPVTREQHFECIAKGVKLVESWNLGVNVRVVGVWTTKVHGSWKTSAITEETIKDLATAA